ncbi:MAG: hypothetical protein GY722_15825 [bacterium]|nr:hypothetical protein [bacterium]
MGRGDTVGLDVSEESAPVTRQRLRVTGVAQGVGFRPTVYQLATGLGLGGCVGNDSAGVLLELRGAFSPDWRGVGAADDRPRRPLA